MKTHLLLIGLFLLLAGSLRAQEHFTYKERERITGIYPKHMQDDYHKVKRRQEGERPVEFFFSYPDKFKADVEQIVGELLQGLSDSDKARLRWVKCYVYLLGDGSCYFYKFMGSGKKADLSKYDELLFRIGERVRALDYKQYGFILTDPSEPRRNEVNYCIPFKGFFK